MKQWVCMLSLTALLGGWSLPASCAEIPFTPEPPPDMVYVAAGVYTPLFQSESAGEQVTVQAFYLDRYPVTNARYLAFVQAQAQWRRSRVPRLFADVAYLYHWQGDAPPAAATAAWFQSPVTHVSWFAARAYCAWEQKRLPSSAEWEYAAQASETMPDGLQDAAYRQRLLEWYSRPAPAVPPPIGSSGPNYWGVYDMHGVVWEWVADFQSALLAGESGSAGNVDGDLFCGAGTTAVVSQQRTNYPALMRHAYRSSLRGTYTVPNLGFRCAKDAP